MQALYEAGPNLAELEALGLTPDDYELEVIDLWPENDRALNLFCEVATQWRMGFSGPVGLDYNVVFHLMGRMRLADPDYDNLFRDLRVAENEALTAINNRDT